MACSEGLPNAMERIRHAACRDKRLQFTTLWHHVYNTGHLRKGYLSLKRNAAPGVDGETWRQYAEGLEENLRDLAERLQRGAYRAKPVKRSYIPKPDGRQRPLGVTPLEDKIVQRTMVEVLNGIYETDFLGFSYGFPLRRSPHDALNALYAGIMTKKVGWVLDGDIRGYLETSSYYTPSHERLSKRLGCVPKTLIRKPFLFPQRRWTAEISPRFTRCNTVCRETPRSLVASCMGT
jgi:RNA-directed DNA polymerase